MIVGTEKVLWELGGPVKKRTATARKAPTGGKVVAVRCAPGPARELEEGYHDVQDKQPTKYQLTPKSKCRIIESSEVRMPRYLETWALDTSGHNHGQTSKTLWFLFEKNLYGHPLAGLLWERQFGNIRLGPGFEKST